VASVTVGAQDPEYQGRPRDASLLPRREWVVHAVAGGAFLVVAALLAVLGDDGVAWRWNVAIGLVVAFAVTVLARFDIGFGYAPPTQLVFVPMLFLEAPKYAPLLALAGWTLGRLVDLARGKTHISRLANIPGNCWFAVGPALVLTIAGIDGPDWGDWPLYLLALVSQFAGDLISNIGRDYAIAGEITPIDWRVLGYVWLIDAALSPIGLIAAFASLDHPFAFLGVLPLAGLLVVFSYERRRRFELELAHTRAREAVIAGASHELQTPLAVMSGLVETLARSTHITEERRRASYDTLRRQTAHLRHLVGQFVDYARLKAGQDMLISPRPTAVAGTLQQVADLWHDSDVAVTVEAEDVSAMVDPARLSSVLMSLVSNAVKYGPPQGPVRLRTWIDGRRVIIEVIDHGPGLPEERLEEVFDEFDAPPERTEGSGVGLFLARRAMRAQGGDVRLRNAPDGGLVATVYLPASPR